jgi:hypothetical protein
MISRAPDWVLLQQQQVIRPVWRHIIIVDCLYPN